MNNNKQRTLLISISLLAVVLLVAAIILAPGNGSFADVLTPEPSHAYEGTGDAPEAEEPNLDVNVPEADSSFNNADDPSCDNFQVLAGDDWCLDRYGLTKIAAYSDIIIRGKIVDFEVLYEHNKGAFTIDSVLVALIEVHEIISRPAIEAPIASSTSVVSPEISFEHNQDDIRDAISHVSENSILRVCINLPHLFEVVDGKAKLCSVYPGGNVSQYSESLFLLSYTDEPEFQHEEYPEFRIISTVDFCLPVDINGNPLNSVVCKEFWDSTFHEILTQTESNGKSGVQNITDAILAERKAHSKDVFDYFNASYLQETAGGSND